MKKFLKQKAALILVILVIATSISTILLLAFAVPAHAQDTLDITEFSIPTNNFYPAYPYGITSGPDGNLWFTESFRNKIGQITLSGAITEFSVPTEKSYPEDIVSGPDGNLWFTENGTGKIGRITPSGVFTEFSIPTINSGPGGITSGPDGNLWFTEILGNKIGRISTDGIITEFTIPTVGSYPRRITTGPDGNLWFTEQYANKIGRITPSGIITEFNLGVFNVGPYGITSGPDGNLWFTENSMNRIGRITPNGVITEFRIDEGFGGLYTYDITTGSDGNLWFTEYATGESTWKIGKITTSGTFSTYSVTGNYILGITSGPDGNIWFTDQHGGKIGRVNLSITVTPTPTPSGTILNVPYFSQNILPWGPSEYDHSQSLGFSNITMDRWGCAVTSAVMVLNYHGMSEFSNNTPLNPGTLNDWLKTHNGYLTGGSGKGSYSYLSWPAISKLTKDLFNAGKSNIKLMHKRAYPGANTTTLLNDDLNIRKFPDILYVTNASTSGHFVVAKGVLGNTYSINDPEWNVPNLSSFNNNYMQVDRYVPSNTNLSYIVFVVNPRVEILVMDSLGRRTGRYINDGQIEEFNQIPDATYIFQNPISNDLEDMGTGVNEFLLPEPSDGNYTTIISSAENESYTLNVSSFESDGSNIVHTFEGIVSPNTDDTLNLNYSQTQVSDADKAVTFQSTLDDIQQLEDISQITDKKLADKLIKLIEKARKEAPKNKIKQLLKFLNQFEELLNEENDENEEDDEKEDGDEDEDSDSGLDQTAYRILLYDVYSLKKEYSN